jgi:hypothetical protein
MRRRNFVGGLLGAAAVIGAITASRSGLDRQQRFVDWESYPLMLPPNGWLGRKQNVSFQRFVLPSSSTTAPTFAN